MVLHYLGDEVLGWKEKTSLYCDDEQFYIHNYLMNEEGKTFYLEHQHGFPTSLNSLLTKHVNVKYSNIGYLCNYDAFWEYDARVSYELKQNRPMIAVVLDMDGNGNSCLHAVVICGIDYNPDSREVEHYYYNDPFYGENISKTRNKWNTFSCVQNNKYLLMTFDIYGCIKMKKKMLSMLLVIGIFVSCEEKQIVKKTGELLTEQEAIQVVADYVMKSPYVQQYYYKGSKKYDSRVEEVDWGEPILIDVIADGAMYKKNTKYYFISGVLPTGQLLAAQTVDAYTGELLEGALFTNKEKDNFRIASKEECLNYSKVCGQNVFDIVPIFYCDGSIQNQNTVFSWKYRLKTKDSINSRNFDITGENYFIDPWVNLSKNTSDLRNDNGFFSRVNYNHRLFKLVKDNGERSVNGEPEGKFIPLD